MDEFERIKESLVHSPYQELRTIRVDMEGQRVVLTGRVHSFYMKQLAQETVRFNGHLIENRIKVDGY